MWLNIDHVKIYQELLSLLKIKTEGLCFAFVLQDLCFDQVEVTRDINTSPPPHSMQTFLFVRVRSVHVRACSRGESMVDNFNPAESLVTFVFLCV